MMIGSFLEPASSGQCRYYNFWHFHPGGCYLDGTECARVLVQVISSYTSRKQLEDGCIMAEVSLFTLSRITGYVIATQQCLGASGRSISPDEQNQPTQRCSCGAFRPF